MILDTKVPTYPHEQEPDELDYAMMNRYGLGITYYGPLTRSDAEREANYIAHYEAEEREHELEVKHGGKTRCPSCDHFAVKHHAVCTLGYRGHPGAEYSDYAKCEDCGWQDLAG